MGMYFILERNYKSPAGIVLTADVAELTAYNSILPPTIFFIFYLTYPLPFFFQN